jgi:hypothetical protein
MWLALRQQKTHQLIDIPVHFELEALLRASKPSVVLIVPSPTGLPWSYRSFARKWDFAVKRAGFEGVQRRGLRRKAMVQTVIANATDIQIAAVSGSYNRSDHPHPRHLLTLSRRGCGRCDVRMGEG